MLGRALLPLRAFLGFTFCFAGLQKLANPGFFQASNPGSIQAQLAGAARRSPIHALISPLTHLAVPLGLLIAVAELAIGLGTLLGLWQRLAAAGGVALSLMLFLTVSFHASPYYTGADIVFAFAWTPLLLAGGGPLLSADAAIAARARAQRGSRRVSAEEASRREVVLKGTVTAVAAVAGLILGGGRPAWAGWPAVRRTTPAPRSCPRPSRCPRPARRQRPVGPAAAIRLARRSDPPRMSRSAAPRRSPIPAPATPRS